MTIIWSLSIVFFVSCESAGDKRLDFALEQAGKKQDRTGKSAELLPK